MLIVTLSNNKFIWKNFISEPDAELALKPDNTIADLPFRLVRNSKLLTHLALIMGISVVVAKLVEFQFSSIASERFKDPDQLTAFFGFWFSTANVLSLAVQLLIYPESGSNAWCRKKFAGASRCADSWCCSSTLYAGFMGWHYTQGT
jgi:AAA family ATP:ADP antiporter